MRRNLAKLAPFLLILLLAAPRPVPAAESPARDDAFYEKYNSYIALINANLEDVQEAIEHYYLSVGESIGDAGPGRDDFNYRNYVFSGATEPAMEAAKSFVAREPKLEVDAVVGKLHPVMTKVWKLLREADAYYGEKAYEKDDFAKGKKLHGEIDAALAEYWPLFDEFSLDMDLMEKEGNAQELAKMLEEGRVVTAAMLKMLNACEEAHAWLEDKDIGDDNVHELEIDGFRVSVLAVVAKARKELQTVATPAAALKEGLPAGLVENYLKTAAVVETCAANMIELAKKGRPQENSPAIVEKPENESPSDFIYQINKLIDLYNQIWD